MLVPDVGGGFGPKGRSIPRRCWSRAAALRLGRPVKWVESRREVSHGDAATTASRPTRRASASGATAPSPPIDAAFLADVGAYPAQGDGLTLNTVNHLPGSVPRAALSQRRHERGDHEDAQRGLSRRRAARGRVRDGAPDGHRRAPARPRPGRHPPAQPRAARGDAVPPGPHLQGRRARSPTTPAISPPRSSARWRSCSATTSGGAARRRRADGARRIGVGLACYAQGTGLGPFEGATVRVDPSGKVYVYIGVAAQGQGHATTLAQIAAAELGAALGRRAGRGGRHRAVSVRHGHRRQPRDRQRRPRRRADRARGARARHAGRRRAARVRARGRAHRAEPRPRRRHAASRRHAGPRGPRGREARRRSRQPASPACTPARTSIPTPSPGRSARRPPRSRSTSRPCAVRLLAYAIVHDPGPRDQSGDRRRPAPGRRRAGHRRRAHGGDRLRRGRPAPVRQPHGLRDPARRPTCPRSRSRSTSTRRPSTRSASRAWARAAPSPARRPSRTRSRTRSPTSARPSARSR